MFKSAYIISLSGFSIVHVVYVLANLTKRQMYYLKIKVSYMRGTHLAGVNCNTALLILPEVVLMSLARN